MPTNYIPSKVAEEYEYELVSLLRNINIVLNNETGGRGRLMYDIWNVHEVCGTKHLGRIHFICNVKGYNEKVAVVYAQQIITNFNFTQIDFHIYKQLCLCLIEMMIGDTKKDVFKKFIDLCNNNDY